MNGTARRGSDSVSIEMSTLAASATSVKLVARLEVDW